MIFVDLNKNEVEGFFEIRCEKSNIYWSNHETVPEKNEFYNWCLREIESDVRKIKIVKIDDSNKDLGYVYFDFIKKDTIEISYGISESFMGKGYGHYLIKEIIDICIQGFREIKKIEAWVIKDNIRSRKILLKNGFNETNICKSIFFIPLQKEVVMSKFEYEIWREENE